MIRDIHGVFPSAGLPPFLVSASVILLGIAYAISKVVGKKSAGRLPDIALPTGYDSLEQLRRRFEAGEISLSILSERLAQILRADLTGKDNPAMTSSEVIESAAGGLSVATLKRIAALLEFCDRVRFGGHRTDTASGLAALDEAGRILNHSAEHGP